jgi:hypothetical protein
MRSVTVACAAGRIYDPSGKNDRAPLDEVSLETLGATAIEYRQGLMGCSAKIRKTEEGEITLTRPWATSSAVSFRCGPARQRHHRGSGKLAGQRADCGSFQRGDPPWPPGPGQVLEPVQPAGGEPAPPLADRVHADVQVRSGAGADPAAGRSQHDLRPQPVPVGDLSAAGTLL